MGNSPRHAANSSSTPKGTSTTPRAPSVNAFATPAAPIPVQQKSKSSGAPRESESTSRHLPKPPPGPKPPSTDSNRARDVTSIKLSQGALSMVAASKRKSLLDVNTAWYNADLLDAHHLGTRELLCPSCKEMILSAVAPNQRLVECEQCQLTWPLIVARMTSPVPSESDAWVRRMVNSEVIWVRMLRAAELKRLSEHLAAFSALDRAELVSRLGDARATAAADASDKELAMQLAVLIEWPRFLQPAFTISYLPSGLLDWIPVDTVKLDSSTISAGSLSLADVLRVSRLPLQDRIEWFRAQIDKMRPVQPSIQHIRVRREAVLEDASTSILTMSVDDLWQPCRYEFAGEKALDSGGVAREFFSLITEQTWDLALGLFEPVTTSNGLLAYRILAKSGEGFDLLHLQYYRFVGRLLAKALIDGYVVSAHLTHDLYKHFMGQPVSFDDLNDLDSTFCRNLLNVADCANVESLCLDFTASASGFGMTEHVDLVENGSQIPVTSENVELYVSCMLRHYLLDRHNLQLAFLCKGFTEIVPPTLISVFSPGEFEALISGADTIDVEDWMRNTEYRGKYAKYKTQHEVVDWFWTFVRGLSHEDRGKLLRFATGSSRVPILGFKALIGDDGAIMPFSIDSLPVKTSPFPRAHTCFNRLELPLYETREALESHLMEALTFHLNGFNMDDL